MISKLMHRPGGAAIMLMIWAGLAAGCGDNTREAEANTGKASAEVETTLPESAVSDTQLQAAAEGAAAVAETPQGSNTSVVVTPPSNPPAQGAPPAAPK